MSQFFYAHLVPIADSVALLDQFQLADVEKDQLEQTILSIYHHHMIDVILQNIDVEHHDALVGLIAADPHDLNIMIRIKELNPDIEDAMMSAGGDLAKRVEGMLFKRPKRK